MSIAIRGLCFTCAWKAEALLVTLPLPGAAVSSSEAPKPCEGEALPLAHGEALYSNGDPGDEQGEGEQEREVAAALRALPADWRVPFGERASPRIGVMRQIVRAWLMKRWVGRDAHSARSPDGLTESPRESGGK